MLVYVTRGGCSQRRRTWWSCRKHCRSNRDLATLVVAIERDHDRRRHTAEAARTSTKETAIVLTA
jgi:hypothetical protein